MSDAVQQCLSLAGLSRMFVLHGAMITCTGAGFASATSNLKLFHHNPSLKAGHPPMAPFVRLTERAPLVDTSH